MRIFASCYFDFLYTATQSTQFGLSLFTSCKIHYSVVKPGENLGGLAQGQSDRFACDRSRVRFSLAGLKLSLSLLFLNRID